MSPDAKDTAKGRRTRARILDSALELFLERGYDKTTMRAVAQRAGVAVGNAYYYFDSKEHLVQGFYARTHEEHLAACEPILARETDLQERLRQVFLAKIETAEPYHRFSGLLFKTAADPASPLNPFSAESEETRERAVELLDRVLEGSRARIPADLRSELPNLVWLHLMSVILFWLHDESEGRVRTRRLIDRTVALVVRLISLASLPLMKPLRRNVLELLEELRQPDALASEPGARTTP